MTVQYSIIALYSRDNGGAGMHGQKNTSQSSEILANISSQVSKGVFRKTLISQSL